MRELLTSRTRWILLLAIAACGPAGATEIYRWVDENGVVNFSQTAPPPRVESPEIVAVQDDRPSDWDPDTDIYGVEEQAARMQALRDEMDEKREKRLEQKRHQETLTAPQYREPEPYSYPIYWGLGVRPPPWPRPPGARPPGVGPPIARPPQAKGPPMRPPGQGKQQAGLEPE
jgi:hypothetical protein